VIASAILLASQAAVVAKFADDALCASLRNPNAGGNVPEPCLRLPGDKYQDAAMIRKEFPVAHELSIRHHAVDIAKCNTGNT
jgi:hypothetical protein